ncbi:MerR family transcriptional regulator [Paenibacillus jiagnxiensis]|uniref:MerR family transcriptional regulator n=1 Tax=Paenibacillus jiagnxiensis TaxID=3228926 RepID=UPI0033B2957B
MLYTVKEVSELSNVTIKTLHHYHKIGLLLPCKVNESGYRLYSMKELERLQQILFYRELDIPLDEIKKLLEDHSERLSILLHQEELLLARRKRLDTIFLTIGKSIASLKNGETMDQKDMFKGFANAEEWNDALSGQNEHLEVTYGMEAFQVEQKDVERLNDQAAEAAAFMGEMVRSLQSGIKHDDEQTKSLIGNHLEFLNKHGHKISAEDFVAQTRFFLSDEFHLRMLEDQQTGLAYYLYAAAEVFAGANP